MNSFLGIAFTWPGHDGRDRRVYAWLAPLIVMLAVTALVIGGVALQHVEKRMVNETGASLALAADDIADKLDLILFERYGDIQMLAHAPVMESRDLSAGLESIAAAGQILVGPETLVLLRDAFELSETIALKVAGVAESVPMAELIAEMKSSTSTRRLYTRAYETISRNGEL